MPEDVRVEIYSHLSAESRRLDSLLSALLDADRLRHGPLQPTFRRVDVGRVVADVVARTVSGPASDGRSIHVEAASADAEVDPPKVERIVENLLANAIKYAPAGTPIGVRVEALDGNVLIAVDDRGSGVEADKRESIFELFDRGDADPRSAAPASGWRWPHGSASSTEAVRGSSRTLKEARRSAFSSRRYGRGKWTVIGR